MLVSSAPVSPTKAREYGQDQGEMIIRLVYPVAGDTAMASSHLLQEHVFVQSILMTDSAQSRHHVSRILPCSRTFLCCWR